MNGGTCLAIDSTEGKDVVCWFCEEVFLCYYMTDLVSEITMEGAFFRSIDGNETM